MLAAAGIMNSGFERIHPQAIPPLCSQLVSEQEQRKKGKKQELFST